MPAQQSCDLACDCAARTPAAVVLPSRKFVLRSPLFTPGGCRGKSQSHRCFYRFCFITAIRWVHCIQRIRKPLRSIP